MRYAIYHAPPPEHPLSSAAASWLGRDAFSGQVSDLSAIDDFSAAALAGLTEDPRRYGFHATLKAPFELAEGKTEQDLIVAFEAFAAITAPRRINAVLLGKLGPFFALVPDGGAQEVSELAAECVSHFDPFRAPLSDADRARRNPHELTEAQSANLEIWGYPYVFDEFRFHMTLTGPVPNGSQPAMAEILGKCFAPFLNQPHEINHIALFVEQTRGEPFIVLKILPLAGSTDRKSG